jgi:glycosyltransferase involved in cell wall biosynthesis
VIRVLFLSWWNPIPPDIGARVRVLSLLRALHDAGHDVDLLTFTEPGGDLETARSELARLGVSATFVEHPIHARRRWSQVGVRARAAVVGRPYPAAVSQSRRMRRIVRETLQTKRPDLVIAETSWMGQYLEGVESPRKILSWQNVDFQAYERRAASERRPVLRALRGYNFRTARRFELNLVKGFDAVITVSDADRRHLLETLPEGPPVHVLPVTVDADRYKYSPPTEVRGHRLLFVGAMFYQPNVDAVHYFHREIYPLVQDKTPDVTLTVVGKDATSDIRRLADRDSSVRITGTVPQVEPYYREADLFVAPIRFGGGMKTKIIEAMAFGVPVVGSSAALEGISAVDGREAAVRDAPRPFANSVVELLESLDARQKMSLLARRLVEELYSQAALTRALAGIVDRTVQGAAR